MRVVELEPVDKGCMPLFQGTLNSLESSATLIITRMETTGRNFLGFTYFFASSRALEQAQPKCKEEA